MSLAFSNTIIHEGSVHKYAIKTSKKTPVDQKPTIVFKIISDAITTEFTAPHIGSTTWGQLYEAAVMPWKVHRHTVGEFTIAAYEKEIMIISANVHIKAPADICSKWFSVARDVVGEWESRGGI